jgi:hypothetical protein
MPFESVLRPEKPARHRRVAALLAAASLHMALLAIAVVQGFWRVDELPQPALVVPVWFPPPMPAGFMDSKKSFAQGDNRRTDKVRKRPEKKVTEAPTPLVDQKPSEEAVPIEEKNEREQGTTSDGEENDDKGDGKGKTGDCLPGADCDGNKPSCPPGAICSAGNTYLPPSVASQRCTHCPHPRLPPPLLATKNQHDFVARVCVGTAGTVTGVTVIRGISASVDSGVVATLQGWHYQPPTVSGSPVPFCHILHLVFRAR